MPKYEKKKYCIEKRLRYREKFPFLYNINTSKRIKKKKNFKIEKRLFK